MMEEEQKLALARLLRKMQQLIADMHHDGIGLIMAADYLDPPDPPVEEDE